MTNPLTAARIAVAATCLMLAGCGTQREAGSGDPAPPLPDPTFPLQVGAFARAEAPVRGRGGITAGYFYSAATDGAGANGAGTDGVVATVQRRAAPADNQLVPGLDLGHGDPASVAAAELTRSLAQIRRFYPQATATPPQSTLITRGGKLRPGSSTTVDFRAEDKAMRMEVSVLCCTAENEVVEYRFRHAASVDADFEQAGFIRAFPWTAAEAER